jgi:hypothetical protein
MPTSCGVTSCMGCIDPNSFHTFEDAQNAIGLCGGLRVLRTLGCFLYSKGSPQTTILPALFQLPNFELRAQSHVTKINLDPTAVRAAAASAWTSRRD